MLSRVRHILEMIRFSHTLFALPFALTAAALAYRQNKLEGIPFRWTDLLGIVLCMVFARSSAMAFNRLVDREIDRRNPRTAQRHLPSGLLSVASVTGFCMACVVGFVGSTFIFLPNRLPLYLSLPVLLFLCGYSLAKRFTSLCHYWLGAALSLSPIAAWIAIRGEVAATPLLLASVVCFWVGGFDIIYACQDAAFDKQQNLQSIPAKIGVARALKLALASHIVMLACLAYLSWSADLGPIFQVGVGLVACLLAYEHFLVRPNDLARVNLAFFHVNAVISVGLFFLTLAALWFQGGF